MVTLKIPAYAQTGPGVWGENEEVAGYVEETGLSNQDIRITIVKIIQIFLGFLGLLAVIIIIYAGFLWMTARGDAEQIAKAKKWMINAVIGLIIILSSFAIASFVLSKLSEATGSGNGGGGGPVGPVIIPSPISGCADPALSAASLCETEECKLSLESTPYICKITPQRGPSGTYVTIKGYHFGEYNEQSKVKFGEAFAEIVNCPGSGEVSWSDKKIVVKVPDLALGLYAISITNGEGKQNDVGNNKIFTVTEGVIPPGIACILPDEGKEGAAIKIYGDYFGDIAAKVVFNDEKNASSYDLWSKIEIDTHVPLGAITGDVVVKIPFEETELESNGYPFKVPCEKADECASGCCYDNSYCAELEYCIGKSCDTDSSTPSCEAGNCGVKLVCDEKSCSCKKPGEGDPCDSDLNAPECQAGECDEGLICDNSSCKCKKLPGEGETCAHEGESCAGGECAPGLACNADACVCERHQNPVIEWISPVDGNKIPNGAPYNLITIHGKNFGVVEGAPKQGKIIFLGTVSEADDALGIFPVEINPLCVSSWKNDEIIIAVPEGAVNGPIEVIAENGLSDRTDDGSGSKISDFEVNGTIRPGLCAAFKLENETKKGEGKFKENVILAGVNLKNIDNKEKIKFGTESQGTNAYTDPITTPEKKNTVLEGVGIPDLKAGDTSVYVIDSTERSNPVSFRVLNSLVPPEIYDFNPKAGHPGDYVTITGHGFGKEKGRVYFEFDSEKEADYVFPQECLTSLWKESQILVKLPQGVVNGSRGRIKVVTNEELEADSSSEFYVGDFCSKNYAACPEDKNCGTNGDCVLSTMPGLCKISPDNGSKDTKVRFYGENFGADLGSAKFNDKSGDKIIAITDQANWTQGVNGQADKATSTVPQDPLSGPIKIMNSGGKESNGLQFDIINCINENGQADNSKCSGDGIICCPTNSYFEGSCMPEAQCGSAIVGPTDYAWSFTTKRVSDDALCAVFLNETECTAEGDPACCWNGAQCKKEGICGMPIPQVVEYCGYKDMVSACRDIGAPSPSPWAGDPDKIKTGHVGGTEACIDSKLRAEFTTDMDLTSFAGNINVKKCNVCASDKCDFVEAECIIDVAGSTSGAIRNIEFSPALNLSSNTWYKVTLKDSIKSVLGIGLDGNGDNVEGGNYEWIFKTRNSVNPCEVGCATIAPKEYTAKDKNAVKYRGEITAKENSCTVLERILPWAWSTSEDAKAPADKKAQICTNGTEGCLCCTDNADTEENECDPVRTDWACVKPIAETGSTPVDIKGKVTIPTGQEQEGKGLLYINLTDFKVDAYWPQCDQTCLNAAVGASFSQKISGTEGLYYTGLRLYKCKNDDCTAFVAFNQDHNYLVGRITPGKDTKEIDFNGNSSFSLSNYVETDTKYRVILQNLTNISGGALTGLNYDSDGDSAKDSFSWTFKTGRQECKPSSVSVSPSFGIVSRIGDSLLYSAAPISNPDVCNGQKLDAFSYNWAWASSDPSIAVVSSYPSCGNGIVEKGEDCDHGEKNGKDGLCTDKCFNQGNSVLCDNAAISCCGNGIKDANEECDNQAGCNDRCLHEGSSPIYGSICGNGVLEPGEDCDGGEGCNNGTCLWEGSLKCTETLTTNCCGNGVKEQGEECDEGAAGNKDDGIGCNMKCLLEGNALCHGACCGNGKLDPGESCDHGVNNNNDGLCGAICLNLGTAACNASNTTNCCGNGILERGEDCDDGNNKNNDGCSTTCLNIEVGRKATTTPYQLVTAVDGPKDVGVKSSTVDISAKVLNEGPQGVGKFTVQCGLTYPDDDDKCGEGKGVGYNGCCYERPQVLIPYKDFEGFCQNGVIEATFSQVMDEEQLSKSDILKRDSGAASCSGQEIGMANSRVAGASVELKQQEPQKITQVRNFFQKMVDLFMDLFIDNSLLHLGSYKLTAHFKGIASLINNEKFEGMIKKGIINLSSEITSILKIAYAAFCPVPQTITTRRMSLDKAEPNLSEQMLKNSNFEDGTIGNLPASWSAKIWPKASVGITKDEAHSGRQSVRIQQTKQENCEGCVGSAWNNHVAVFQDVSNLNWQAGQKYTIQFYYKGTAMTTVDRLFGQNMTDFQTFCYAPSCQPGEGQCVDDASKCCKYFPVQKGCFAYGWEKVVKDGGVFNDWQEYSSVFTYTGDFNMNTNVNPASLDYGKRQNLIGIIISYANTGEKATDFFVDDFTITKWQGDDNSKEVTVATIQPDALLVPLSNYQLDFNGLKNQYGVSIKGSPIIGLKTNDYICLVDHVDVRINKTSPLDSTTKDIFICAGRDDCGRASLSTVKDDDANDDMAGNQHLYTAQAIDQHGQYLNADYSWSEIDPKEAVELVNNGPADNFLKWVTANPVKEAESSLEVVAHNIYEKENSAKTTVNITSYMCENPWPSIDRFPYSDSEYNFSTFYCRDNDNGVLPDFGNDSEPICSDPGCKEGAVREYLWVEE